MKTLMSLADHGWSCDIAVFLVGLLLRRGVVKSCTIGEYHFVQAGALPAKSRPGPLLALLLVDLRSIGLRSATVPLEIGLVQRAADAAAAVVVERLRVGIFDRLGVGLARAAISVYMLLCNAPDKFVLQQICSIGFEKS